MLEALHFQVVREVTLSQGPFKLDDSWPDIIFMSGCWEDLALFWNKHCHTHKLFAVLHLSSIPDTASGFWYQVHHSDVDGVLDGQWWWGTAFKSTPLEVEGPTNRHLDISTRQSNAVQWIQGLCHPRGLFPATRPHSLVLAPSVFTKWTM